MKLSDIITNVSTKYGAPLGRRNIGSQPVTVIRGKRGRICKKDQVKVYEKRVPLMDGGYDRGGAYWGTPSNLYVRFTKDLSYIEYFRK
jgi:hypothetical protein